jgi:hypothetical protein
MNVTLGPTAQQSRGFIQNEITGDRVGKCSTLKMLIHQLHQAAELLSPVSDVEGYKE